MSSSKPDYVFSFLWHLIFKIFLVVVVEVGSRLGIILSIGLGSFFEDLIMAYENFHLMTLREIQTPGMR